LPALTDIEGLPVLDPEGRELGSVSHVLFHPEEPRAVALEIIPVNIAIVIARKPRYLALSAEILATCGESQAVHLPAKKLPSRSATEKLLGYSTDTTVIWRNMEVRLKDGTHVGYVADVGFSRKSGKVLRMLLSEGSLADFAVGKREVSGELVRGFDGTAVVVKKAFRDMAPRSGGLAGASGKGVAYAKIGADKAADAALAAGVAGLGMMERSFRSGWGSKAMRGLKRAGKRARKAIDGDGG
jgi:uncharacterized protein YrrD